MMFELKSSHNFAAMEISVAIATMLVAVSNPVYIHTNSTGLGDIPANLPPCNSTILQNQPKRHKPTHSLLARFLKNASENADLP